MLKEKILNELIRRVELEISGLEESFKSNHNFATDQEFKAESKYDTRSLEASYLASAEARRVEELKLELSILNDIDVRSSHPHGEISIGSLVELSFKNQVRKYFLIPTAGGSMIEMEGETILVVSVFSPLGSALLGLKKGDDFEVSAPKEMRHYLVLGNS